MSIAVEHVLRLADSFRRSDKFLFLMVGSANTVVSFTIYEILLFYISYQVSYLISFCAGVIFSAYFNSRISFEVRLTAARFIRFATVYVVIYLISQQMLVFTVEYLGISEELAPLVAIAVVVPLNYLGSRIALAGLKKYSK